VLGYFMTINYIICADNYERHIKAMKENRIHKRVLYMKLETKDQEVDQEIDGKIKCGRMEE
jgi:hypothetical protein